MTSSPKTLEPEARRRIVDCLKRNLRPILIGEASLLLGEYWTLQESETLVLTMQSEGLLRETTPEENVQFGIGGGFFLV